MDKQRSGVITGLIVGGVIGAGCLAALVVMALAAVYFATRPRPAAKPPPKELWTYQGEQHGNDFIVDTDGVTLIFEGVKMPGMSSGQINIAGRGRAAGGTAEFWEEYHDGIATIRVRNRRVSIVRSGTLLVVGTKQFDLAVPKKTVHIHANGSAELYNPGRVPELSAEKAFGRVFGIWRSGNQPRAERESEGYLAKYPDDVHLLFFEAACLRGRYATAEADRIFRQLEQRAPGTRQGKCAFALYRLDEKIDSDANFLMLEGLVHDAPRDPLALWMLAVECRDYRRSHEGLQACRAVLALASPSSAFVHQAYANHLGDTGRYREALEQRLIAARLQPAKWSFDELADTLLACNMRYSADIARQHALARFPEPMSTPAEIAFPRSERRRLFKKKDRLVARLFKEKHVNSITEDTEPRIQEFMRANHVDRDQMYVIDAEGAENRWDIR